MYAGRREGTMTEPSKEDPALFKICGVPALTAYREAYKIALRIERGCEMSIKGFRDAVHDAEIKSRVDKNDR